MDAKAGKYDLPGDVIGPDADMAPGVTEDTGIPDGYGKKHV